MEISIESSRGHLSIIVFYGSRTSVFRLEHFTAAINLAFEHFFVDGMFRGDVCSQIAIAFTTDRALLWIVSDEFGSISTPL